MHTLYKHHVLLLKGLMLVAESRYPGGDKNGLRGGQLEAVEIAQVRDGGGPERGLGSDQSIFLKAERRGLAAVWMWHVRERGDSSTTARFLA